MKLRPLRRLPGLCLYCGTPCRGDVCGYCSDLPLRDPLVAKARQPLSEAERIAALRSLTHETRRRQRITATVELGPCREAETR